MRSKAFWIEQLGEEWPDVLKSVLKTEEFVANKFLTDKTTKLVEKIEEFKKRPVDHQMLTDVLKIQSFVNEATK